MLTLNGIHRLSNQNKPLPDGLLEKGMKLAISIKSLLLNEHSRLGGKPERAYRNAPDNQRIRYSACTCSTNAAGSAARKKVVPMTSVSAPACASKGAFLRLTPPSISISP